MVIPIMVICILRPTDNGYHIRQTDVVTAHWMYFSFVRRLSLNRWFDILYGTAALSTHRHEKPSTVSSWSYWFYNVYSFDVSDSSNQCRRYESIVNERLHICISNCNNLLMRIYNKRNAGSSSNANVSARLCRIYSEIKHTYSTYASNITDNGIIIKLYGHQFRSDEQYISPATSPPTPCERDGCMVYIMFVCCLFSINPNWFMYAGFRLLHVRMYL